MKCGALVIGGGICHPQPTTLSQRRQGGFPAALSTNPSVTNFFRVCTQGIYIQDLNVNNSTSNLCLGLNSYKSFHQPCGRCLCWCMSGLVTLLSPSFSIGPARRHIRQPRPRPNPTKPRHDDTWWKLSLWCLTSPFSRAYSRLQDFIAAARIHLILSLSKCKDVRDNLHTY